MSELTNLIDRNQQLAAHYKENLNIIPRFSTIVLTCSDARIDPAHYLGLELGDAFVIRNGGAGVSKELEMEIGILWTFAGKMAGDKFRGFELVTIHHTDCGYERLANADRAIASKRSPKISTIMRLS